MLKTPWGEVVALSINLELRLQAQPFPAPLAPVPAPSASRSSFSAVLWSSPGAFHVSLPASSKAGYLTFDFTPTKHRSNSCAAQSGGEKDKETLLPAAYFEFSNHMIQERLLGAFTGSFPTAPGFK